MLQVHITIATISLLYTTAILFAPSVRRLWIAVGLTILTLATGVILVLIEPVYTMRACINGSVFLVFALSEIAYGRRRLVRQEVDI